MKNVDFVCFYVYAEPKSFCDRHIGNALVRRCCHKENRYVAEMRAETNPHDSAAPHSGFIDYVEDGEEEVKCVEGHRFTSPVEAEDYWMAMIAKMYHNEPPDGEK